MSVGVTTSALSKLLSHSSLRYMADSTGLHIYTCSISLHSVSMCPLVLGKHEGPLRALSLSLSLSLSMSDLNSEWGDNPSADHCADKQTNTHTLIKTQPHKPFNIRLDPGLGASCLGQCGRAEWSLMMRTEWRRRRTTPPRWTTPNLLHNPSSPKPGN